MLSAAATGGIGTFGEALMSSHFVVVNTERCINAIRGICSVLARCTSSEVSRIVRSVTELGGVEARARLHTSDRRRTLDRMFSATLDQRECMHTKPAKEVGHVEAGDHAVGGDMECDDFRSKERREDSWLVEDISTGGGSSRGREGAHGDEARRDRRERREPQGKAGVVHDEQRTTDT